MSDHGLRQLEQRASGGGQEDAARYLAALVRTGRLSRGRVVLAARLGNPVALAVAGPVGGLDWGRLGERQGAIELAESELGPTLPAWLAAECAGRVLHLYESRHPGDVGPRGAVMAARAWVDCPCKVHSAAADVAADVAHAAAVGCACADTACADVADAACAAADAANAFWSAGAYVAASASSYAADAYAHAATRAAYAATRAVELAWQVDCLVRRLLESP